MVRGLKIRTKLFAILGFISLTLVALAGISVNAMSSDSAALSNLLEKRLEPLGKLKAVADAYAVAVVDASHKVRNGQMSRADALAAVTEARDLISSQWEDYNSQRLTGEEASLARTAHIRMGEADLVVEKLIGILQRGDARALDRFVIDDLYQTIDPVSEAVSDLVAFQMESAHAATNAAKARAEFVELVTIIIAIAILAVLGAALLIVRNGISRPLESITGKMQALASGQKVTITGTERSDEIGDIARACELFRASADVRDEMEKSAADQREVSAIMTRSLKALAEGDLSSEIREAFPEAYADLKLNYNQAIDALRTLIGSVTEGAAAIRCGSEEISSASEDLARRTETNAASLEETSAALSEVDSRVKDTSTAAQSTVDRADQAMHAVGSGRKLAESAVQAMERVSENARDIDTVIEGLDKIAFQTRVLAMNAAVEAGRAGEAGRGFAVVADLVSALAMRAEEEAQNAREQLTVTQSGIQSAVDAVTKVDGALVDISAGVDEVHQLLGRMTRDNQAQSSALTQVTAAINEMDKATQQNAAMVEQTSAAARNLSGEVNALAEQAGRFKIGEGAAAGRAPARKPANGVHEMLTRIERVVTGSPPATKQVANGGAVPGGDVWNDF